MREIKLERGKNSLKRARTQLPSSRNIYVILKSFRIEAPRIVLIPSRMQIALESPRDFYERIKRKSRWIGKPEGLRRADPEGER